MKGFHVLASGAIQGHYGPLVQCVNPLLNDNFWTLLEQSCNPNVGIPVFSTPRTICELTHSHTMTPFDVSGKDRTIRFYVSKIEYCSQNSPILCSL